MKPGQKDIERGDVQLLLRLRPDLQVATIDPSESPDFVLTLHGGARTGLEVTRLTREAVTRAGANASKLRQEVQEALETARIPAEVQLNMAWPTNGCDPPAPDASRRVEIVGRLTNEVTLLMDNGAVPTEGWTGDLPVPAVPELRSITVSRSSATLVSVARFASRAGTPSIQACIDAKNAKLVTYRQHPAGLTEFWLLLVSGHTFADPFLDEAVETEIFSTSFDRVFFLARKGPNVGPIGRCDELQIRHPA